MEQVSNMYTRGQDHYKNSHELSDPSILLFRLRRRVYTDNDDTEEAYLCLRTPLCRKAASSERVWVSYRVGVNKNYAPIDMHLLLGSGGSITTLLSCISEGVHVSCDY